jgi:hypothetical protein
LTCAALAPAPASRWARALRVLLRLAFWLLRVAAHIGLAAAAAVLVARVRSDPAAMEWIGRAAAVAATVGTRWQTRWRYGV